MYLKLFFFTVVLSLSQVFGEVIYTADFTRDFKNFRPYSKSAPVLKDGKLYAAKGTVAYVAIPGPGRYQVKASVSGDSMVQLVIFTAPLNSYGVPFKGNKEHTMSVYHNGKTLPVCLATLDQKPFVVEKLTVEREKFTEPESVEIKGRAFEAEDFPGLNGFNKKDKAALNGSFRRGNLWYLPVQKLPAPYTAKPVYLYARCRAEADGAAFLIVSDRQRSGKINVNSKEFKWVKSGAMDARTLNHSVDFSIVGKQKGAVDIDRIVWSTNPNLTEKELNSFIPEKKNALISAFPTDKAPVIDGILSDSVWNNALELTPFLLNTSGVPAQEQTVVKLLYTSDKLFLAFQAYESALVTVNQRMHEFRNNQKSPDVRNCYKDDVVLLLLKRKNSPEMYEFVVNASGVVTVSKCTPPKYWSSRTAFFKKEVKAAGKVKEGEFHIELEIPFSIIGGKGEFEILLGRVEHSRGESSSYGIVNVGFHELENLVPLHFAERANCGSFSRTVSLKQGKNDLGFKGKEKLFLTSLETEGVKTFNITTDSSFEINKNGSVAVYTTVLDAATLETILVKPVLKGRTQSLMLSIPPVNGAEVKINGKKAQKSVLLTDGVNEISVSGPNAKAQSFRAGDLLFQVDSSWKNANGIFHKKILVNHSVVWPDWTANGVYVMDGHFQMMQFPPVLPKGLQTDDYKFHIDLPSSFTFEGAVCYYQFYPVKWEKTKEFIKNSVKYTRYTISTGNVKIQSANLPSFKYIIFGFRAPETQKPFLTKMYFHASSEKLFLSEIPVECRISVIKSEPVKTPEHVVSQIYTGRLWNVRSRDFVNKVAENAMRSGYTHFGVKNNTPLKSFHTFHFEFWELSPKTFLEKNPGSELISLKDGTGTIEKKAEGMQYSVFVCPTVMKSEKFAKWLDIEFPEWYKRSGKPDVLCWDFEYNMYSSCLSCICKRCLKIFAEKNNIKEALTKEIIVAKYKKQWIDHLTSNLADVCKQLKTALVKFAPEAKIYIYSGYQSETTREIYGVDWKKLQPYIDLGGGGYGRPVKEIAATMNAMGNKPFLIGIIAEPYEVTSRIPPKPVSEAEIMRSYCDSRGGILTYMYSSLDGITLRANAKVSRIIAENEEFFIPGKYTKVSGKVKTSGGEAFVRSDPEGNLLVVFVNNGASPVKCKAVFPGKGNVIDCISGKTVSAAEKSVPSGGIAVFRQNR